MQDLVVLGADEGWLKVVIPHLVLVGYVEAKKIALSSGHPVVAKNVFDIMKKLIYVFFMIIVGL